MEKKSDISEGLDIKTLGFFAVLPIILGLFGWVYGTFQTQREAETQFNALEKRLERVENKLDGLIERVGTGNQKPHS